MEPQAKVWKAEPCSLQHSRPIETARDETLLKRMLLRLFGFYTRESRLLRGAKALHAAVQEPAKNPALYEGAAQLTHLWSASPWSLMIRRALAAHCWQLLWHTAACL